MRRASSWISGWGSVPAISRASASASSDKVGTELMERVNAWRSPFRATTARPRVVFGPALARAFTRLALILAVARQAAFFPSISLISSASIS